MKRTIVVAAVGLALSACGGGGGGGGTSFKDPDKASFTYGTPGAPSTDESAAAEVGASGAQSALSFVDAGVDTASTQGEALAGQPTSIASGILPGDFDLPASRAAALGKAELSGRAVALLEGKDTAASMGWDDDGCVTLTASDLTFNHCTKTISDPPMSGQLTASGVFHRAAGHVSWDATMNMELTASQTTGETRMAVSERVSGDITLSTTDRTVVGFSRVDASAEASSQGRSEGLAVTFNVDYDLGYATTPSTCVDSGTLTVKRLWARIPSDTGSHPETYTDASVRFTWTGCGTVTVERSW
jgi:hypothetical protein